MSNTVLLQSNTNFFGRLRALGRRIPLLKRVFLPVWTPFTDLCWRVRNVLTARRPLRVTFGASHILMHPVGQIAQALWVSQFEAAERGLVAKAIRPGMIVVNIGANAGLYTLMAAKLTGRDGHVHAFEPSTTSYARLERNVTLNNVSNVSAHRLALSDAPGRLVLRSDPKNQLLDGHRFVEPLGVSSEVGAGDEVILCDTLDHYFAQRSQSGMSPPVDLLIMDVEGAEWSVLKGATAVLGHSPHLFMILECSQHRAEVGEFLAGMQFRFYTWNPATARLEPAEFETAASMGNVVACRGDPPIGLS